MAGVDKFKGVRLVRLVQCLVGGTEGRLSKCSLGLTHDQRVMRAIDYLHSLSICWKRRSDLGPALRLGWCVVSLIDRGLAMLNVWSCALLCAAEPQSSPQRHYFEV
jgi:hypothetical protein